MSLSGSVSSRTPLIKPMSVIVICSVPTERINRNLNDFTLAASAGSCCLWVSLMAWAQWGQRGHWACSIHRYIHAFIFLPLHPILPLFLYPSIPPRESNRDKASVVTCWRNTSFLSPSRHSSHCCTLFSIGDSYPIRDKKVRESKNGVQILPWSKFRANPRQFIMKLRNSSPQDAVGAEKWGVFMGMFTPREPPILQNTQKPLQLRKSLNTKWLDARRII